MSPDKSEDEEALLISASSAAQNWAPQSNSVAYARNARLKQSRQHP
jgi:hypothetical protein